MKTVAIFGVGLIGGSFGLALRENGFIGDVIGVSSESSIRAGLSVGAITAAASAREAAAAADVIYLAQPVDRILRTIEDLADYAKPGTLVTDAGSTKAAVVAQAVRYLPPSIEFLGGHPMAGKEQRGATAAEGDLFRDRPYVLTPHLPSTPLSAEFRSWLLKSGARIIEMSPEEHDSTVAFSSHLPQLISTALAVTLARQGNEQVSRVSGSGLTDMTRLAMSSSELWVPIFESNKAAVSNALQACLSALVDLHTSLTNDTLWELFEFGAGWAREMRQSRIESK